MTERGLKKMYKIISPKQSHFYGVVVKNSIDGYSFIGQVRRGFETVATNGDVFVPMSFPEGTLVEFAELNSDRGVRAGCFRTEKAWEVKDGLKIGGQNIPRGTVDSLLLRRSEHPLHTHAKKNIPPDKVETAIKNQPFEELIKMMISQLFSLEGKADQTTIERLIEEFLAREFCGLSEIVSFSFGGDVVQDREKLEKVINEYTKINMNSLAANLRKQYDIFEKVKGALNLLRQENLLSLTSLLPPKNLVELTVMAPVVFLQSKWSLGGDKNEGRDYSPSLPIKYLCKLVGSREFALFFQMYNRPYRLLGDFRSSIDFIHGSITKVLSVWSEFFDHIGIWTPYFDEVTKVWASMGRRNVDPFLLGFIEDFDYIFFIGRWSGTGIFPLMYEMVADTMDHLLLNKSFLGRFPGGNYWTNGKGMNDCLRYFFERNNSVEINGNQSVLPKLADDILAAYQEGRLFPFLKGEKKE